MKLMIVLTFTKHPMVLAAISGLAVAGGYAEVRLADLVLSTRGVIAHNARVYPDRRGLGQPRATCRHGRGTWRGGGHAWLPLGDGHVGLHVPVDVHGLHWERRADNLTSVLR